MPADDRIFSPTVISVLVFGVLLRITSIWLLWTLPVAEFADWFEHSLLLGLSLFEVLSVIDAGFLIALGFDLPEARRAAAPVRRGRITGVVLAACVIVGIQLAAMDMRQIADFQRFVSMPPTIEELRTEPIAIQLGVHGRHEPLRLNLSIDRERRARVGSDLRTVAAEFEVPEAALDRFRELLARGRYCEIDGTHPFRVDVQPPGTERWLVVRVGQHYHMTSLVGREVGLERIDDEAPPVEPDAETLRRILDVWDAVLSWTDDPGVKRTPHWEYIQRLRSMPR
jgi:hypothetical protein